MSTDQNEMHALPNIVLVHGAWADGSSWSAVIERLQADGYMVAQDDQALPPDAQRMFAKRMGATTVEVPSGHLAMVSHPAEVVNLTEAAAAAAFAVDAVA
jgi:hypothetical protein